MSVEESGDDELHELVALGGRILAGEGLSRVSFGHVSVRSSRSDEVVALRGRPRGDMGLEYAVSTDVLEMTMDAEILGATAISAPRECYIHLEVLRARPDVASVVHIHPRLIVALRAAGRQLLPIYGAYDPDGVRLALDNISYYPKPELIDTPDRGRELAAVLGDTTACILDGHGIVTVGDSVQMAVLNAIALCELAHVTWLAAAIGEPRAFEADRLRELVPPAAAVAPGGHSGAIQRPGTSSWQHWVERDRRRQLGGVLMPQEPGGFLA